MHTVCPRCHHIEAAEPRFKTCPVCSYWGVRYVYRTREEADAAVVWRKERNATIQKMAG